MHGHVTTLDSLADVELQLCMQPLDNRSRLLLARCSRRLYELASGPLAWKGASPLVVKSINDLENCVSTSLIRSAPIHQIVERHEGLDRCAAVPRPQLASLDVFDVDKSDEVEQYLAQPHVSDLGALRLGFNSVTEGVMHSVAGLEHLHTLQLHMLLYSAYTARILAPLSASRSLRHLRVIRAGTSLADEVLAQVRVSGLEEVTLAHAQFSPAGGFRVFLQPHLCGLRAITLYNFNAGHEVTDGRSSPHAHSRGVGEDPVPTCEDYADTFAGMHELRTLTLHQSNHADPLLQQLHHAPSLRKLVLHYSSWDQGVATHTPYGQLLTVPSLKVIRRLVHKNPLLEVQLMSTCRRTNEHVRQLRRQPQHKQPGRGDRGHAHSTRSDLNELGGVGHATPVAGWQQLEDMLTIERVTWAVATTDMWL